MRRRVGFSWLMCGLWLGCGGGREDEAGSASAVMFRAGTTGMVGSSTGAPLTGGGETDANESESSETDGEDTDGDCPAPLERCGDCVDVLHDPQHCGGCAQACAQGLVCVEGECAVACGPTATACGPVCSVLASDPQHCGACDHPCAPGVACTGGSCVPECAAGQQLCGEACVDLGNDEAHCGACDAACPEGQPCAYGLCDAAQLRHLLITGQSLSTGTTSLVVSSEQSLGNLAFNTGVRAGGVGLTGFIPLVETWDGKQGETSASGLANLVAEQAQQLGAPHVLLVSSHGVGGKRYSKLKKGTAPYAEGMAQVQAAMAIAAAQGLSYAVRGLAIVHGETDHWFNNPSYEDDLLAWQSDYQADVAAITGATGPLPMFMSQMSSFTKYGSATSRIPGAQLAAARARPDRVFVVGPKYFLPYTDGVHLTGEGSRWLGEYHAKAYRKVVIEGERWLPVQPEAITREGAVITIRFAVPAPPLVLDEVLVADPGNYGFEFTDSSETPPAIAEVALVDPVTVRVTLASAPVAGNRRIRYAHTGPVGQPAGPSTGARGNLRDSDATPSRHGYLLYNWAVHFDEPVD